MPGRRCTAVYSAGGAMQAGMQQLLQAGGPGNRARDVRAATDWRVAEFARVVATPSRHSLAGCEEGAGGVWSQQPHIHNARRVQLAQQPAVGAYRGQQQQGAEGNICIKKWATLGVCSGKL